MTEPKCGKCGGSGWKLSSDRMHRLNIPCPDCTPKPPDAKVTEMANVPGCKPGVGNSRGGSNPSLGTKPPASSDEATKIKPNTPRREMMWRAVNDAIDTHDPDEVMEIFDTMEELIKPGEKP